MVCSEHARGEELIGRAVKRKNSTETVWRYALKATPVTTLTAATRQTVHVFCVLLRACAPVSTFKVNASVVPFLVSLLAFARVPWSKKGKFRLRQLLIPL